MTTHSTTPADETTLFLGDGWSDPLEAGIRDRIRDVTEQLIEEELAGALGRGRYERRRRDDDIPGVEARDAVPLSGHRHGHRERQLIGSSGPVEIAVPRARVGTADGRTDEWKSKVLPRYARMTRQVEALIAGTYLAGTNTRRVRRALAALFRGAIGKDLHEDVSADYTDMIYADSADEIEQRRKAFLRKWRLKCRGVADSLEEAGERLFTFTRLPSSQWRLARTSNAVERLHEEFKRRIKTQTVLPSPETAAMLFWALLASGQITMRKVDGWQTLATKPTDTVIDLAA